MAEVKWIKIATDIFDDEKIILIESLPDSYAIITVWFKLLCLAGKQNNSGVFMMNNRIAYTDKMLATIFRMKESTITLALQTFEQFGMIEMVDDVITIPNWDKHQTLDSYEKRKARDRQYQQERRNRQKLLALKSTDSSTDASTDSSTDASTDSSTDVGFSDKEVDIEVDKNIITVSKDTIRQTDVQRIVDEWNSLSQYGIKSISKLSNGSKRYQSLVARINQYGVEEVIKAIDNIRHSDFLQGKVDGKRQWVITFDWFVLPNNFPKVLEGNYENQGAREVKSYESTVSVQLWE